MLIRGVIWYEIENDAQSPPVRLLQQIIEVLQGSEHRIDIAVIRDVVAEIFHRRWIDWRDPDGRYAQPAKIIEARRDAFQIADAVVIRVLKGTRVDFVNNSAFPPGCLAHLILPAAQPGDWRDWLPGCAICEMHSQKSALVGTLLRSRCSLLRQSIR